MTAAIHPGVRAALFDIDGTLTSGGDVWRPLVSSRRVHPVRKAWLYATGMPHYLLSKPGLLNQAAFRDRWVRLMAWLITGWSAEQVRAVSDEIVQSKLMPALRPDVVAVMRQHQAAGHPVLLVSTMFDSITGALADHLGVEAGLGSIVEMRDGACAGRIAGETCSGGRKLNFAWRYLARHHPGVTLEACAAYADSASDIDFLSGVGHPVAVYPDERMHMAAEASGWSILPTV